MPGHYMRVGCLNPYEAVSRLNSFLVGTVGWTVAQAVADTGSFIDIVFRSTGEPEVPNGFPRYIRLASSSDSIVLSTYETFISTTSNTGELSDASFGKVATPNNNSQGFEIMVVADLERVIINVFPYTGTSTYTGYAGRITSYHRANEHNYPNIIKCSTAASHDWYYTSAERNIFMLGPDGTQRHYYAVEPLNSVGLSAGESSDRDGTITLAAPVIVRVDANPQYSELVGEPRGMYRVSSRVSQTGNFLTIAGEVYVTFVQNGVHMVMGPVGTTVPPLTTSFTA